MKAYSIIALFCFIRGSLGSGECIDSFPDDHQSSKYFLEAFPANKEYLDYYPEKTVSDIWPYCSWNCNQLAQSADGNGCYYKWSDLYCSKIPEIKVRDTCKVACKSCCSDGIQNQGEEGVDCGGPCKPCKTPVDCKWSDWEYGECTKTCGGGKRTNYRKELMHQSNGGMACSGTAWETEECNTNPCLKYVKIQLQTLCSAKGLDAIKTKKECKAAAKELGLAWGNTWNGAKDFPDCIFADDKRRRVYFNTHKTGDTTLKNCKNMHNGCHKYAAICKV